MEENFLESGVDVDNAEVIDEEEISSDKEIEIKQNTDQNKSDVNQINKNFNSHLENNSDSK